MESRKKLSDLDPLLTNIPSDAEELILSILDARDKIILLQQQQIERINRQFVQKEAELKHVKAERDLLHIRLASSQTQEDASTDSTVTDVGFNVNNSYLSDSTDDT